MCHTLPTEDERNREFLVARRRKKCDNTSTGSDKKCLAADGKRPDRQSQAWDCMLGRPGPQACGQTRCLAQFPGRVLSLWAAPGDQSNGAVMPEVGTAHLWPEGSSAGRYGTQPLGSSLSPAPAGSRRDNAPVNRCRYSYFMGGNTPVAIQARPQAGILHLWARRCVAHLLPTPHPPRNFPHTFLKVTTKTLPSISATMKSTPKAN